MRVLLALLLSLTLAHGQGIINPGNNSVNAATQTALNLKADLSGANIETAVQRLALRDALSTLGEENGYNWQPWSINKVQSWIDASSAPLVVARMGDSISAELKPGPTMAVRGYFGNGLETVAGTITLNDGINRAYDYASWCTGVMANMAVGSSGIIKFGATSSFPLRGNTLVVIYRTRSGGGTFNIQVERNNSGTWTKYDGSVGSDTIDTNGAAGISVVTRTLSQSGNPYYRCRIQDVATAEVRIIGAGIYYSSGPGVVYVDNLFGRGALDPANFAPGGAGNVTLADFKTAVAAVAGGPDLLLNCWYDPKERWEQGSEMDTILSAFQDAGSFTVGSGATSSFSSLVTVASTASVQVGQFISGTGIPANTRIVAINSGTSLSMSQLATATGSGQTFTFRRNPDVVMVSPTPYYLPSLAGKPVWATATSYTVGTRVYMADYTTTPEVDHIFECTSSHTSGALNQPVRGANWQTVWQLVPYDSDALAASDAAVREVQSAQRAWCLRNRQTYWDGASLFRDYQTAAESGMMVDYIHPSTMGYRLRNQMLWSQLALGRMHLGAAMRGTELLPGLTGVIELQGSGTPSGISAEIDRDVVIRGSAAGGSAGLSFSDQLSQTNRITNSQNVRLQNLNSELSFTPGSANPALITGFNTQLGIHPGYDGAMLGGREGKRWRGVFGSLKTGYRETTANTTFATVDYTINVTANSPTITLPLATARSTATGGGFNNGGDGLEGTIFVLKNSGAGTVTMATTSSQLINGGAPGTVAAGASLKVQSTGSGWITIP
jgi:hypothetical protein